MKMDQDEISLKNTEAINSGKKDIQMSLQHSYSRISDEVDLLKKKVNIYESKISFLTKENDSLLDNNNHLSKKLSFSDDLVIKQSIQITELKKQNAKYRKEVAQSHLSSTVIPISSKNPEKKNSDVELPIVATQQSKASTSHAIKLRKDKFSF